MSRNQPLSAWTPGHYPVRVFSSADPFGGVSQTLLPGPPARALSPAWRSLPGLWFPKQP